jgi:hypothetical protein
MPDQPDSPADSLLPGSSPGGAAGSPPGSGSASPPSNEKQLEGISLGADIGLLPTPDSVNLEGSKDVNPPDAPVDDKLPPLDQAGVDLAKWVLWMISIFVLISIAWAWTSEMNFSSQFGELMKPLASQASATNSPAKDVLEVVVKARTDFRDFWLKVFQTVLLNVLLPVLTALLGYVFGSRRSQTTNGKESS